MSKKDNSYLTSLKEVYLIVMLRGKVSARFVSDMTKKNWQTIKDRLEILSHFNLIKKQKVGVRVYYLRNHLIDKYGLVNLIKQKIYENEMCNKEDDFNDILKELGVDTK